MPPRHRSRLLARASAVLVALAMLTFLVPTPAAEAVTAQQVQAVRTKLAAIQKRAEELQKEKAAIQQQLNALAVQVTQAMGQLQVTTAQLTETRDRLTKATAEYKARVGLLEDRARDVFMNGVGSNLDFLLSSQSLGDLSDRLEYVDRISASDAQIASDVQSLRNELRISQRNLEKLRAKQQAVLQVLQTRQAQLDAEFKAEQAKVDALNKLKSQAQAQLKKLSKQLRQQQSFSFPTSSSGGGASIGGILQHCPVGQPHAYGDDFGAPRYSGGFHLHAGNDILAPMGTPIYAPFNGSASSDNNGLGGLAVIVRGSQGYVYNAHLSAMGKLGAVQAGDVIGYVGNSGDAAGGPTHDHFEWHPNSIPSNWPKSSYGYSVIGDAVNPNPILNSVC
jgi:peptidoglycan hydrolase CwlO-like protein